ncbi:hypothetical protein L9F63_009455, partial [Diploptera punctata]
FKMSILVLLSALLAPAIHSLHHGRGSTVNQCTDTRDCHAHQCCVLGGNRYSMPTCTNLGLVGEPCRPYSNAPYNMSLTYPNDVKLDVTNVYFVLCDCAPNLLCDGFKGTCQSPDIYTNNDIDLTDKPSADYT